MFINDTIYPFINIIKVFVQHLLIFIMDHWWRSTVLWLYSYSICWYLSVGDERRCIDRLSIRTASVDIYLKSILVILLGNQCIRTAPVDIYCIKYVLRIKYVCIRTAPVNIYLKMLKRIDFYKALYSYSTCWCLSNTKIVGNRTNVTYSYRTCWCLSLIILGFINYIIIIKYWYCKVFRNFTSKYKILAIIL